METVNKTRASYSISEKAGIIIKFDNLKSHFGLNLSAKDYTYHKGVDSSILYRCQKEPARKDTLKHAKENLSKSLVRVKGGGRNLFFPNLKTKIIRQAKNWRARKMYVLTHRVKLTMMNLVKEHYFVDGTWRSHQAQGFLASHHWLLALMYRNNFGLKRRSNKYQNLWKRCYCSTGCFSMVCVRDARCTVVMCFYVTTPVIIAVL